MRIGALTVLSLYLLFGCAQQSVRQPDGSPLLTVAQMHQDLDYLRQKILAQHSHPFLYTSQADFEALYADIDHGLTQPLPKSAFYLRAARLAASLKDGHTLVNPLIEDFRAYSDSHGVFPLEVTFVGERLYVVKNATESSALAPATEITAVNGASVAAIVEADRQLINDVHPIYDVYARLFR